MKIITVLDTSISTDNLGDEIIMDAVYDTVREIAPNSYVCKVATHDFMGKTSRNLLKRSDLSLVGGTNLLDSTMFSKEALWKLHYLDLIRIKPVVLLATGWRRYSGAMSRLTHTMLSRTLSSEYTHSVRDSYTASQLEPLALKVSNTSCVTMWGLTPDHCRNLPRRRAASAVTTLTYYHPNANADAQMLRILTATYPNVYFWSQQAGDIDYFNSLAVQGVKVLPPSSRAYTEFLDNTDVDFIGTRLHGGVRAMQKGHRALIVAIDNRALEIGKDTDLPVAKHGDLSKVEEWIGGQAATEVRLPVASINAWKSQFKGSF